MSNPYLTPSAFRLYTCLGFSAVSFGIGLAPFTAPVWFGKIYGLEVATRSEVGYQQALGVRDAALGLAYLLSFFRRDHRAIDTLFISHGFIGLGDALVVWLNDGDLSVLPSHLFPGFLAIAIGLAFQYVWTDDGGKLNKKE